MLFPRLLAIALARQSCLYPLFLARFQIKRVSLDLFDNVLGLDLSLEAAQGIFQRLTLLHLNFCQSKHPHSDPVGLSNLYSLRPLSQAARMS